MFYQSLLFLLIILAAAINALRPSIRLKRADKKLRGFLQRSDIKNRYTTNGAKLEASLQLAYAKSPERLQYIDGGTWVAGLYKTERLKVTIFMTTLAFECPHLYFDNKSNNKFYKKDLPLYMRASQLVHYEGYIQDKFSLYAPAGYNIDALVVAAPDFLASLLDNNLGADIELLGNQLYYVFPKVEFLGDKLEALITASQQLAESANDNLSRYIDKHPSAVYNGLSSQGRRIIRN